jgi:hypothetical protein
MSLFKIAAAYPKGAESVLGPVSVSCVSFLLALAILADRSAQIASELHQSSCPGVTVSPAFSSFDQLRIGDPLAVCGSEKRIDAIALFELAPIVAPRELVKVTIEMFGADKVVYAEHLPL